MYHWIYVSTAEFDTHVVLGRRSYTALATSPLAVPEVGDDLILCEIVKGIYDISRTLAFEVTSVSTVPAPNGSSPAAVRWTASLAS